MISFEQYPIAGSKWQHLKSNTIYRVMQVSRHTETDEQLITYVKHDPKDGLFSYDFWTRPLAMFLDGRFEHVT